jgi:hypothetical protein
MTIQFLYNYISRFYMQSMYVNITNYKKSKDIEINILIIESRTDI